jgi:catechol 2,3-dioxygenase-like lactoylglutathione lyase family enzyme
MSVDWKLEVVIVPVADVDRAKEFYDRIGFHLDVDHRAGDEFRVVQFTPPGSGCSITFGKGIGSDMTPGSLSGMHLVVTDIEAAYAWLSERNVEVGEVHHFENGQRVSGPHPTREDYGSFSSFKDPDGNTWVVQEVRHGAPA